MKLGKIISRIERKMIFFLDGINTRLYMRSYNKWLKNQGLDLVGKAKYIHHTASLDGVSYRNIHIGDNVVISKDTIILVHDFSLEAGLLAIGKSLNPSTEAYYVKDVAIGKDCFIGARSVILGGTKIGDHCIVGAGTVIPGKVYPDYSIIVGNPGKVIGDVRVWAEKKYKEGNYDQGFIN